MSRIYTGLSGIELRLLDRLSRANAAAALSSYRLATDHKINAARDNPSGFVTKTLWEAELAGVKSTLSNVTQASTMVAQTQLALDQIRTQLEAIRTAAVADREGSLTPSERAANQAAIDAAVAAISTLANTTAGGKHLLDGSADFSYAGVNNAQIIDVGVQTLGPYSSRTIAGSVSVAATRATLTHTEGTGSLTADATITLAGSRGEASIELADGDTLAEAAAKINAQSDLTCVTASVTGNDLKLTSIGYGTQESVAVTVTDGTFVVTGGSGGVATGTNATATINGQTLTGDGNTFALIGNGFQGSVTFAGGFAGAFGTVTVSGQGLDFALSTDLNYRATLAIPGLQPSRLGGLSGKLNDLASGGSLSGLDDNAPLAIRVVDEALAQLTILQGRVDGFARSAVESSRVLLQGSQTNLAAALDALDTVDPAEEAALVRQVDILATNALAGLAILNQQRQNVLSLILQIAKL